VADSDPNPFWEATILAKILEVAVTQLELGKPPHHIGWVSSLWPARDAAADSATRSKRWRAVAAASLGNALEWFDFVIYGYFAVTIAKLFFPAKSDLESLLIALATFGITFFIRPLGAILLGAFADRHGRKQAFMLTIALMMFGTAIIAVIPTYAAIGPLAPIAIVIARLIQGISAGGGFGSATAFLAEQDPKRRGFFASWQFASQGLTTVIAAASGAILTSILTTEQIDNWGWRIPFIFGLLIGPVAYYLGRHADETAEFQALAQSKKPFLEALSGAKTRMLVSLGAVVLCTVLTYTTLFMPGFAIRQLGLPQTGSFLATLLTGAIQIVLAPIFGAVSDRRGRLPIMLVSGSVVLVVSYPMFAWLAAVPTLQTLLIVQAIMGVLGAAYMGPLAALMSDIFPTRMRTTGLAVSYSFCVAIFGGFAPFINAWLISATGSNVAPSFYLMFAAAISLTALAVQRGLRL
jgi:MHS family proline/betaine transporter-like MFS transporter